MPRLCFIDGPRAGECVMLEAGDWSVGRTRDNAIVLADRSISAHHCRLSVHGEDVTLHDLGGRNGTFVQELRVQQPTSVSAGETLRFGSVNAVLQRCIHESTVERGLQSASGQEREGCVGGSFCGGGGSAEAA